MKILRKNSRGGIANLRELLRSFRCLALVNLPMISNHQKPLQKLFFHLRILVYLSVCFREKDKNIILNTLRPQKLKSRAAF